MKQELLTIEQIAEETHLKPATIRTAIRTGELKGKRMGRTIKVLRQDLNNYLGITNDDEVLKKDLEIARLKNQVEGYKNQYNTLKQLMATMQNVMNVL